MAEVTEERVRHEREVEYRVAGVPEHRTPNGARPIAPQRVQVSYHAGVRGASWASVEIAGHRLYGDRDGAWQTRRFLVTRDAMPAADRSSVAALDVLPGWVQTLVLRHWPDAEWFATVPVRLGPL